MADDAREVRVGVNLLVLTDRPPGGTGHHAISLFEALIAAELEGGTKARFSGFAIEAAARHFSPEARSRLVLLPSGSGWRRALNELVRLPLAARKLGVDRVINPAFLGAPWGSARRAMIIHDLYFRSDPRLVPWRRRALLRIVVPLLGRRSDTIFAISHATRSELQRFYPDLGARAVVLYSGNRVLHDADADLSRSPLDRPYLLMVGHLTANKAPEVVLASLRRLRDGGRRLALVHIGDDYGRLGNLPRTPGDQLDVVALGPQPDPVLAVHYAHCVALVLPSIREGFGLPLIEAQAYGAPVIASSCGALMEVGGDSALYFPIEDVERCTEAIVTLLDHPETREMLLERGYANSARFRWDETARRLLDVLELRDPGLSGDKTADQ